jgi:hypothetical protein
VRRAAAGFMVFVVTAISAGARAEPAAGDRPRRQLALQTNLSKASEQALAERLQAPSQRPQDTDATAPAPEPRTGEAARSQESSAGPPAEPLQQQAPAERSPQPPPATASR